MTAILHWESPMWRRVPSSLFAKPTVLPPKNRRSPILPSNHHTVAILSADSYATGTPLHLSSPPLCFLHFFHALDDRSAGAKTSSIFSGPINVFSRLPASTAAEKIHIETVGELYRMSARAIAASRSRDSRPLSAYDEPRHLNDTKPILMAMMQPSEVEARDRKLLSGSCGSLLRQRPSDAECGGIYVLVEDITTIHANDSMNDENVDDDAYYATPADFSPNCRRREQDFFGESRHSAHQGDNRKNGMRPVADVVAWAVPKEYSSSPIVKELSQPFEERPKPPTPPNEYSCSDNYTSFTRSSHVSRSKPEKPVSLLEQIIRTHTICLNEESRIYLEMNDTQVIAIVYVEKKQVENFIVRASSRENCMALSVCLGPGFGADTDHYIIQKLSAAVGDHPPLNLIRLEGSQLKFRSLPLLIEHYCTHDEELQTRLVLPAAIRACRTTKQLQSVALMEQDFWTSDMSLSRSGSRSTSRSSQSHPVPLLNVGSSNESTTSFIDIDTETSPDGKLFDACYNTVYETGPKNLEIREHCTIDQKWSKKRTSSTRQGNARFATIHGDLLTGCIGGGSDEVDSGSSGHSPPTKHDRVEGGLISRTERRSQSVRNHKSANPQPKVSGSATLSRASRPRSFLKSLFFGNNSSTSEKRKPLRACDIEGPSDDARLANCDYFTPWGRSPVKSSRSAFDITSPTPRGVLGAAKRGGSYRTNRDEFDDENYTSGWKFNSATLSSKTSSPASSRPDGFMRTFKPAADEDSVISSRVRPLPMRRERSDLCGMSLATVKNAGTRLARHNESSPGPVEAKNATVTQRKPMTPPQNANDPHVIRSCVEEIRRKRLQLAKELNLHELPQTSSTAPAESSGDQSRQVVNSSPRISLRAKNGTPGWRAIDSRGPEHRLSVPNLVAAVDPTVPGSVGQSARALREKLGRQQDGELSAINEGLVTPVVRRKNFESLSRVVPHVSEDRLEAEVEDVDLNGKVSMRREALEALFDHSKPSSRPTAVIRKDSIEPRCSDLVWRRAKAVQKPSNVGDDSPSCSTGTLQKSPVVGAKKLLVGQKVAEGQPKPVNPSWSAVNCELKTRQQKIAKVRPTPQPRRDIAMTIAEAAVLPSKKNVGGYSSLGSDYAQLADFSTTSNRLEVPSRLDDDNLSVAGTVFNEPWDSNVWENLLDLAHHSDEVTSIQKFNETIQEEDSDSDRTTGAYTYDDEEAEEGSSKNWTETTRRTLPSDRVVVKAWENHADSSKYSTLDSRLNDSFGGTLKRNLQSSSFSLPRALSRASHMASMDDLPTSLNSMSPLLGQKRLMNADPGIDQQIGRSIQEYVERLARVTEGKDACFGLTLRQFIACTKETRETDPAVVVRNVRQFLNGIKNYLVKHGEGELHGVIDAERSQLNSNQILNIDAVLEAVLHKLLLREVKPLLYHVMCRDLAAAGISKIIAFNMEFVRSKSIFEMGFSRSDLLVVPSQKAFDEVKECLRRMQSHYSPLKKLQNLMKAVHLILSGQKIASQNEENSDPSLQRGVPAAADLVRWLVYILSKCTFTGCEVEAWYMWELLPQPILMQSDASYYLTALFSAVHVLKNHGAICRICDHPSQPPTPVSAKRSYTPKMGTLPRDATNNNNGGSCDAFFKIALPDETTGSVRYTTFPGVPQMTAANLCRVIAHQQGITNPEDHGLYLISDGIDLCLASNESPFLLREQLRKEAKNYLFAYKRHQAKIFWSPNAMSLF
ncbi:unnamed protein product [Caenorhabditis auriculariae]|uniref:Protein sprint n=1 Tax=Caenorhabditis auriculariae TaxID=2777116 RepID=A0A8S1GVT0_9PELO|nr:unnamed protein product [Caenorhabditis auriculariae]